MKKKHLALMAILIFCSMFLKIDAKASASDGEQYITISVDAADDNSGLMYAIDSDAPENFSNSNTFTIPAGTSHTIYVKDVAGNITSQQYVPTSTADDDQNINIDMEIGGKKSNTSSTYDYLTDSPAEEGGGSVYDKVTTDGSNNAEKVFYSVTTKDGETFYLIIDQGQSANNVYLLDQVTNSDLQALAVDDTKNTKDDEEDNLLKALSSSSSSDPESESLTEKSKTTKANSNAGAIIGLLIVAIGGGVYYYLRIYKSKRDMQMDLVDAKDIDEFEPESEEGEEITFDIDDDEKQEFLDHLIDDDEEEDSLVNSNEEDEEEEYATSHITKDSMSSEKPDEEYDEYDEDLDGEEEE